MHGRSQPNSIVSVGAVIEIPNSAFINMNALKKYVCVYVLP